MANHSLIHFSCLQNEENNLDWFNEQVSVKMMLRKHSEHYKHYSSLIQALGIFIMCLFTAEQRSSLSFLDSCAQLQNAQVLQNLVQALFSSHCSPSLNEFSRFILFSKNQNVFLQPRTLCVLMSSTSDKQLHIST